MGFAFISFKDRGCVTETLEEIDLVKQNLAGDKKSVKLGIADWQVERAYPPADIIWEDIQHVSKEDGIWKQISIPLISVLASFISFFLVLVIDDSNFVSTPWVQMVA